MSSLHQGFQEETGQPAGTEAAFAWLDRADGPRGRVAGIDASPAMITEARRRAAGLTLPITFEVGDACQVPFADNSFDLCRTERVLRYLDTPQAALAEMVRVARPGGWVLVFDFDSDSTVIDAPDPVLSRRIAEVLDAAVPHPWIGRQLFGLIQQAGLHDIRVIPHAICVSGAAGFAVYEKLTWGTIDRAIHAGQVTPGDVAARWQALEQARTQGRSSRRISDSLPPAEIHSRGTDNGPQTRQRDGHAGHRPP